MDIEFIYASPLSYLHYRQARKAAAKGKYVVIAINAPTDQSRKVVISHQVPKWAGGELGLMVIKLVHGGMGDKRAFEESYRDILNPKPMVDIATFDFGPAIFGRN
jgi:long-subunit acyl-CoA synthetase (AMP-forming)